MLESLANRLSSRSRAAIGGNTACLELTRGTLRVAARASALGEWIRAGHLTAIDEALDALTDGAHQLAIIPIADESALQDDPYLALSSFIVSPSNAPARSMARAFVDSNSRRRGPLLIVGPSGSGKSHLLRAIAAELSQRSAGQAVLMLTSDQLSMELVNAICDDDIAGLRSRVQGAAALLIDDVDQLEGKDATQDELERALEQLRERGVPVAMSSTTPLERVNRLQSGLGTQLSEGSRATLSAPEWETRVAIILDRIRRWQIEAVAQVAALIASPLGSSLQRLDVMLTNIIARCASSADLADPEFVKQALEGGARRSISVSADQIIALVARHFDVRLRDLRSPSRSPRVTTPRQIAIYLIRRHCGLSYPEIARRFDRHHTTAIHSDRLVQRQLQQHGALRSAVVLLEKDLLRMSEAGE